MTLPSARTLCDVIDVTWPAAAKSTVPGFTIRQGLGGGKRVSAATATAPARALELPFAEAAMRDLGQDPHFMIRDGEEALDNLLADHGYLIKDVTNLYAAPIADIAIPPPPVTSFQVWPPLKSQDEIWLQGGVDPARIAIMHRATCPKSSFLGRLNDRPAGVAFAGISNDCAMLHGLLVAKDARRQGLAAHLTQATAVWGQSQGATWYTLAAVAANEAANALYTSLGMTIVGQYHYRIKPDA